MGRSVIYCALCGGPLEDVYNSVDIHESFDERFLPSSETKVGINQNRSLEILLS